ncbi:MAG: cytochrome c [Candidatus Methanoperedens sp.]|nr:cytochrome c [Candidatus Methanoperedens sp.]
MKSPGNLIIAIVLIVIGLIGLFALSYSTYSSSYYSYQASGFQSNGERIYFAATSGSGEPIVSSIGQMTVRGGMMSCATCHGPDGKGGKGRVMMWTFDAPDIRYSTLIGENYTDELIKRAITKGIDEEEKQLQPPMPGWQMPDSDLNDLIGFLKTLK